MRWIIRLLHKPKAENQAIGLPSNPSITIDKALDLVGRYGEIIASAKQHFMDISLLPTDKRTMKESLILSYLHVTQKDELKHLTTDIVNGFYALAQFQDLRSARNNNTDLRLIEGKEIVQLKAELEAIFGALINAFENRGRELASDAKANR